MGLCCLVEFSLRTWSGLALSSLFSKGNKLNLRPVPSFLPMPTAVEKFLIARVYIYLQVVRIRG